MFYIFGYNTLNVFMNTLILRYLEGLERDCIHFILNVEKHLQYQNQQLLKMHRKTTKKLPVPTCS